MPLEILSVIADPMPPEESVDRRLGAAFFEAVRATAPRTVVTEVDLYAEPPPFFDYRTYRYLWYPVGRPGYTPSPEEEEAGAYARAMAARFNRADVVTVATPMWNYSVPAILKAWIDQVICPGQTYRLMPDGPVPLHRVKRMLVFATSGGAYAVDDPRDCLLRLVRCAFGFIGIGDVAAVWAEGQNRRLFPDAPERLERAMVRAAELGREIAAGRA
jgi:FMN-dependent NADH-azoreductase